MMDEEEKIATTCIEQIFARPNGRAIYHCMLFRVLYPEIDAVIVAMESGKTFRRMFVNAPFDAHLETIYRIAKGV